MKKVLAILFATMFVVATTGLCFARPLRQHPRPSRRRQRRLISATDKSKVDDKARRPSPRRLRRRIRGEEVRQEEGREEA